MLPGCVIEVRNRSSCDVLRGDRFFWGVGLFPEFTEVKEVFACTSVNSEKSPSHPARSIVRQDPGRRIIHITALPLSVGHPEIDYHLRLAGIILLKYLAIQQ